MSVRIIAVKPLLISFICLCLLAGLLIPTPILAVKPVWTYPASSDLQGLSLSGNGSHLLSYGAELLLLDRTGKRIWSEARAQKALFLPAQAQFVALSYGNLVSYDTTGTRLWSRPSRDGLFLDLAASPEGTFVAAVSEHRILLFDRSGYLKTQINQTSPLCVGLSSRGSTVGVGTADSVEAYTSSGSRRWSYFTRTAVEQIRVNPRGGQVVATTRNRILFLFANGTLQKEVEAEGTLADLQISSNGGYVAAGTGRGEVYLFTSAGEARWRYVGNPVSGLAVSSNGKYVGAGSTDATLTIFDQSGEILWKYRLDGAVRDVDIFSDDRYIAAVSDAGTIYLFDLVPITPSPTTLPSTTPTVIPTNTTRIPSPLPTTSPSPLPTSPVPTTPPVPPTTAGGEGVWVYAYLGILGGIVVLLFVALYLLWRK